MYIDHIRYLGNGCATICYLPYRMDEEDKTVKDVKKAIDESSKLALVAITADIYQTPCHALLEGKGFKRVVRFASAHNREGENLTLWVKPNSQPKDRSKKAEEGPDNCSVAFNRTSRFARMNLLAKKPKNSSGYVKIPETPFWYRVAKKHTLKTLKAK